MNLELFDKESKITPYLVRLYDSQKLDTLAADEKPLARAELSSAVTELFEMELSDKESELIADVLVGLIRQAELDLREALAERLAVLDNAPLRAILQLANDEIEIAKPVLAQSSVLGDMDLIYIIKSKGPQYWQAIAKRESMSHQIMNMLSDTRDLETAIVLAKNENITLTDHVMSVLSDMARHSETLAQPLLQRDEISPDIAAALYRYVGKEIKAYIKEKYNIEQGSVVEAVDDVMAELIDASNHLREFVPTKSMMSAAARYKEKDLLTIKLMLSALRRGQIQAFIAQFSTFTGLSAKTTLEIISQPSGQGLAVVCRAHETSKEDFVSIFLLTNRVRTQGRMVDLNDLTKAVNYFNRIKVDVAQDIMKNSMHETVS